ncbi:vitamin B12-dependent ribonucleotide reductase, partial [Singulisphaera rosea]
MHTQELESDEAVASSAPPTLAATPNDRPPHGGLKFLPHFCPEDQDPFERLHWRTTTAEIKDADGNVVFVQKNVEVPFDWSDQAARIVASKYFYGDHRVEGDPSVGGREYSVRQLVNRVASQIAYWGFQDGYFTFWEDATRFRAELASLCLGQYGAFNSPVWFNVGLSGSYNLKGSANNWRWDDIARSVVPCEDAYLNPQASACFIQSVTDDMGGIMDLARSEAMLFKYGSGTGTDLSTLRSTHETLAGGGKPSGPVSFMRVYDAVASVVKSGGKTRRAAKMQTLKVWHPDILDFVDAKPKEDAKARALIAAGYSSGLTGSDDEAYSSVAFQNANLSVRVTDEFMQRAEAGEPWPTRAVTTGRSEGMPVLDASEVLDRIAEGTWRCGDPGMQYEDTIQRWHTCPNTAPINSSNPCSEYMHIDESACNLASINLAKFRTVDGGFDAEGFRAACRVFVVAQEILVDRASYPTKGIASNTHRFRQLGLGYANLGSLLMACGLPYDSEEGRDLAASITSLMGAEAYRTSAELAVVKGPFDGFAANRQPMLGVVGQHANAAYELTMRVMPRSTAARLADIAFRTWTEAEELGSQYGHRNSQVTVLAPTGTIAFMMDCDTTGVEPSVALVAHKSLAGGGTLTLVNRTVPLALEVLGYGPRTQSRHMNPPRVTPTETDQILDYLEDHGTIEGAPGLKPEHLPVFDCAFPISPEGRSIHWMGHLLMMSRVQPFLSGAISKTCNMPADSTVADIRQAYLDGWKLGLKALAIYRDGSKGVQPLTTSGPAKPDETAILLEEVSAPTAPLGSFDPPAIAYGPPAPHRERLPATRQSLTHKFSVDGHEGYVTVGLYPDGRPGELFITMAKEGSTIGGLMDVLGTSISVGLQYGVPLEVFVEKFAYVHFAPSGMAQGDPDIPIARSVADYIFRWLGMMFLDGYRVEHAPHRGAEPAALSANLDTLLETVGSLTGALA